MKPPLKSSRSATPGLVTMPLSRTRRRHYRLLLSIYRVYSEIKIASEEKKRGGESKEEKAITHMHALYTGRTGK